MPRTRSAKRGATWDETKASRIPYFDGTEEDIREAAIDLVESCTLAPGDVIRVIDTQPDNAK